jgi:formamidopyrimidine-DNA glycosylase
MPEMPEVETVRRRLAPLLEGRVFSGVEISDGRLTRPFDPLLIARELDGERVQSLGRRGKYLLINFESGRALVVHLRMTGSLRHITVGSGDEPSTDRPRADTSENGAATGEVAGTTSVASLPDQLHRRAVVMLDDGTTLVYNDVRRFGTWLLLEPGEVEAYIDERVGPEPLEPTFGARHLGERLERRHAPIKAVLLDQKALAGVGNIYADEALWRAKLHPLTPADSLTPAELKALHRAVRKALEQGLARQGSTLRDYRLPDGGTGQMQHEFKVYGRGGEPCDRCGTPIDKIRVAGRGTWYCPACQIHRPL